MCGFCDGVRASCGFESAKPEGIAPCSAAHANLHRKESIYFQRGWGHSWLLQWRPDRAYDKLYAVLKGWGRYELVAAPGDAELVFEISFAMPTVAEDVSGGNGFTVSSRPVKDPQFRLAIVDLKTHVLLWTFTEHVQPAGLQMNRDKNFDQALTALVNDVRNVAGQPGPAASGSSR
jgi:hypothetical protein